ncbi:hypothetical protein D3C78_1177550 [compost metagenome]
MGNDFQHAMFRRQPCTQIGRRADEVGGGPGKLSNAAVQQGLEQAFGGPYVVPKIARQPYRNAFTGREAGDDFTHWPDVMHVLVRVQMAGHQPLT